MASPKYIVGIDEVGRGALAGPVVVAAFALPNGWRPDEQLYDSKKLTPLARYKKVKQVREGGFHYCLARIYPKRIDRINVSAAANAAAERALGNLSHKLSARGGKITRVYLDGGLYLRSKIYQESLALEVWTVVKGDEKFNSVKLASIVAKVSRDSYMIKLHKLFPQYGFDAHKGYGTKIHRDVLRRHGVSAAHRLTFTRKINSIKKRNGRRTSKTSY